MIRRTELPVTDLDKYLLTANLQCVYMHIAEQKDKWECESHTHEFLELGYIYKGMGSYHIDGTDYTALAGDIFIIPPFVSHYEVHDPENPFQVNFLMVKFEIGDHGYIDDMVKLLQGKVHMDQVQKVKELFDDITDEVVFQNPGYLSIIDAKLKSLLILLYRKVHLSDKDTERSISGDASKVNKNIVENIDRYLSAHIDEKCNVEALAQKFFYHPKYLSRIFQNEKGMMLSSYIQKLRDEKARTLLAETDMSMEAIAEALGYSSVSHFYRSFKKENDKTPFNYRKLYLKVPRDPFV